MAADNKLLLIPIFVWSLPIVEYSMSLQQRLKSLVLADTHLTVNAFTSMKLKSDTKGQNAK